jgi:hypothetical protein
MTVQMQTSAPYAQFETHEGNRYQADINGLVSVAPNDVGDLLNSGATLFNPLLLANYRNILDGGDFSINPWQRNIPGLASGGVIATPISNTPTYFPDRWFAASASSAGAVLMSAVADTSIPGFSTNCKVQRASGNANTGNVYFGQVLETADCVRLQNQTVTLSFWAKAGTAFSDPDGTLDVYLYSGTGTNQSAAGLIAGSWSNQTALVNGAVTGAALTTSMQRYQFSATVPANATQLGVLFGYGPSGTAGSDDSFSMQGIQLEIGTQAGSFEHRDVQVELEICQRYNWTSAEPAAGVIVGVGGAVAAANNQVFYMATPVQMLKAPSVTLAAGSFKVAAAAAAATATGMAAGTTHTPNAISIVSTLTQTVGLSATLQGGGGSGYIMASADF